MVVCKVDRLTRSLVDFAKIVESFDSQNLSFVSVTQTFNTTTSMGRLRFNVPLSFAQFEREAPPESRKSWIVALDWLPALNPAMVVAGRESPSAPDSPSMIQNTKCYLQDFDRLQKTATSDQDTFDQMMALYPDWIASQLRPMLGFPGV